MIHLHKDAPNALISYSFLSDTEPGTANCRGAYDAFKAAYDEMNATLQAESFADGFSLGLRLGIESYGRETAYGRDGEK